MSLEKKDGKIRQHFKNLDKGLIISAILLSVFSCFLIYTIVQNKLLSHVKMNYFYTQVVASAIGVIFMFAVSFVNYKKVSRLWLIFAPVAVFLVLLTFTSLGVTIEGADDRGWLDFGFIQFQPSEVLKLAFLLTFSYHLSRDEENMNKPLHMVLIVLHALFPIGLIILQKDDGTALVFAFMTLFMLISTRVSWRYLLIAVIVIPIFAAIAWQFILGETQKERILILFNPGTDARGLEYQQNLSLAALAAGGLLGKGFSASDYVVVPELYNDFIFSYIGETAGFIGCIATLLVLAFICTRIVIDARKAKDTQGLVICSGTLGMVLCHCIVNIGMALKVMPVIGVPLPFLSAGGTSIVSMYVSIGLVLSTYTHNKKKHRIFYDAED